jgi:hypothetical protein
VRTESRTFKPEIKTMRKSIPEPCLPGGRAVSTIFQPLCCVKENIYPQPAYFFRPHVITGFGLPAHSSAGTGTHGLRRWKGRIFGLIEESWPLETGWESSALNLLFSSLTLPIQFSSGHSCVCPHTRQVPEEFVTTSQLRQK